jgi:small subunit ribosomal protein S7
MDNLQLQKLVNSLLFSGKKARSQRLLSSILFDLKVQLGSGRSQALMKSIRNVTPSVRLRSKRKAGVSHKIPFYLSKQNQFSYALRWLRQSAKKRSERGFKLKYISELLDARSSRGEAYRKRESLHQTALLNRGLLKLLK